MRQFARSVWLTTALCSTSAALIGQQPFRATASLLTLDVAVVDGDGRPVPNLAPEDFVVSLSGETVAVRATAFLANESATHTLTARRPSASALASPASAPGRAIEPDPRLFVILADDMSIYPTQSKGLFVAAERFVASIPARDWVGLTTTSGRVVVNPALERAPLLKDLKRMFGWMDDPRQQFPGEQFVGLMEAQMIYGGSQAEFRDVLQRECGLSSAAMNVGQMLTNNPCASEVDRRARNYAVFAQRQTRSQLDAYMSVIAAMASAPGVKQLVILTGGVALLPQDSAEFVPVAKAAAAAGVQISMLMEEPADEGDLSLKGRGARLKDDRQMLQQAMALAEVSGGQFFRVIGQADRFFERVLTSASAVYRIGVELPKAAPPDGNYKMVVTVKRPGVKVMASRYAAPPPPAVTLTPEEQVRDVIRSGALKYEIAVQMTATVDPATDAAQTALRVIVEVPGDTPGPLFSLFGIVGPDGTLRSGRGDLVRSATGSSYQMDTLIPVAAGTYTLRFAVSDASGAVGAIAQTVVVK